MLRHEVSGEPGAARKRLLCEFSKSRNCARRSGYDPYSAGQLCSATDWPRIAYHIRHYPQRAANFTHSITSSARRSLFSSDLIFAPQILRL